MARWANRLKQLVEGDLLAIVTLFVNFEVMGKGLPINLGIALDGVNLAENRETV